jgi:hypothetical protein
MEEEGHSQWRGVTTLSRHSSHIFGVFLSGMIQLLCMLFDTIFLFVCDGKLNVQLKDRSLRLDYYLKKPCLLHLYLSESNTKHLVEYLFSLLKMWNESVVSYIHWLSSTTHDLRFNSRKNISLAQQMQHTYILFLIIRSLVKMFQVNWSSRILGKPLISKHVLYNKVHR